jgi:Tfp pilus assembly protein PilO
MARQSLNVAYLILTGLVLVIIVLIPTVYRPLWAQLADVREDTGRTRQQTIDRQTFLKTIDTKIAELRGLATPEQELAIMLPADESFADALRIIHQAGGATGMTIESVTNDSDSVQAETRALASRDQVSSLPAHVLPLRVQVKATGSYQQIRQWLDLLEKSPRLMDVHGFSLQRNEQQPDQITGTFTIDFYQYQETQ